MESPTHPATPLAQLSCGYRNSSDRMVIVRCLGPEEFFLERVVFPFELLSFLAPPESVVEIWTHGLGGPELLESIAVAELLVEPTSPSEASSTQLSLASQPFGLDDDTSDWQQAV
jgi:Domain of unknown function (DUF1830)